MSNDKEFPAFSLFYAIFAIPCNFLVGFVVGIAAPLAAIAAMVAGVRFVTGKFPFPSLGKDATDRRLSIELVAPDEVGDLFEVEKKKVMGELGDLQAEIKGLIEEAQSEAKAAMEQGGDSAEA